MKKLILSGLFVTAIVLTALNFYNNANENSLVDIIAENINADAGGSRQGNSACGTLLPANVPTCVTYGSTACTNDCGKKPKVATSFTVNE
ncbi:MAG: hypothetical protein LBS69_12370 [Prevotellaceae bacterium]|jgi:hypothetical protein|nr:hypothetical protein [Prevotellaceae bacterium]